MPMPNIAETDQTQITQSVRELWQGRSNAVGTVTLAASATTTTVIAVNVGAKAKVHLTPQTANAATAIATTFIAATAVGRGQFVITHVNNAQTDRIFGWVALG